MSLFLNLLKRILHRMLELFQFGKKTISDSLNIYVKISGGNTLSVQLDRSWDIGNVKEIVAPRIGLEPNEIKIIFAGKELSDQITIAVCVKYFNKLIKI